MTPEQDSRVWQNNDAYLMSEFFLLVFLFPLFLSEITCAGCIEKGIILPHVSHFELLWTFRLSHVKRPNVYNITPMFS